MIGQERVTPVEGTVAVAWSGSVVTPASCWGWSHTGWAVTPLSMVSLYTITLHRAIITMMYYPGKKLSGVYARVSEALDWIRETVTDGQCYA